MTHPAIVDAAQNVAAVVAQHQKATEEIARAEGARAQLTERLDALDTQRASIVARRRSGDGQPDDGAQLALIEADREGLTGLLADADAIVAGARRPLQELGSALAIARQNLQQVEDEAVEAALVEHAVRLDSLLQQTVAQIGELRAPLGRHLPVWNPSPGLWDALRRIQAAKGLL